MLTNMKPTQQANPYLSSNYAPVQDELDIQPCLTERWMPAKSMLA